MVDKILQESTIMDECVYICICEQLLLFFFTVPLVDLVCGLSVGSVFTSAMSVRYQLMTQFDYVGFSERQHNLNSWFNGIDFR